MSTVYKILETKGTNVYTINADVFVYDALKVMVEKNVGALVVLENEKFKGVFTERDYARKVIMRGRTSRDTRLSEIIEENWPTVTPDNTVEDCMNMMTKRYIRHLPVFENDKLAGLISIGDLVKYIIDNQKFIIHQMEDYIAGSR